MIVLFISNSSLSYVTFFSTFSATLLKPSIPKIEKKYIYMVVVKIHYCVPSINPTIIISDTKVELRTRVPNRAYGSSPGNEDMNWSFMDQCGVDLDVMIEYENVKVVIILKFIMLFPDERTTSFWLFVA